MLIIIGILAAIAIPVMSKQTEKAKVKKAVAELKSMKTIVDINISDAVANPSGASPSDAAAKTLLQNGGFSEFTDPWGNAYKYKKDGDTGYLLYSMGADGSEAAGSAADNITATDSQAPKENVAQADANGGTSF
ncbi:MAG TPA: hypothetical protein DCZ10_14285 [Pelotomaculum sp.]|nr:hypothetical protein [Pelotomaculum sp.]